MREAGRGFTLYEVMVTLFLLGIIFVSAGELAKNFSSMHREQSTEARMGVASRDLLKYLASRSRQAVSLQSTGGKLTLEMPGAASLRYGIPPYPESLPAGWQPEGAVTEESYELVGETFRLSRATEATVLLAGITGFEPSLDGQRLTLALSWQTQRRIASVRRVILLPRAVTP